MSLKAGEAGHHSEPRELHGVGPLGTWGFHGYLVGCPGSGIGSLSVAEPDRTVCRVTSWEIQGSRLSKSHSLFQFKSPQFLSDGEADSAGWG